MLNQQARRKGIGASEIYKLFFSPFALYLEKMGLVEREPATPEMIAGQVLERGVLTLYELATQRPIEYINETRVDRDRPWRVYTPDAVCKHEARGVDAKVVSWHQRHLFGNTPADLTLGKPEIALQVQAYMDRMNLPLYDVAAYVGAGFPLVFTFEADHQLQRVIDARCEEFYRRYLVGNERPPIDGAEITTQWVQQAFPRQRRSNIRRADADEAAFLDQYLTLRVTQASVERHRARLDNELRELIGDDEGIAWADGKITWRKSKDRVKTDWESIALPLLRQFVPDEEQRRLLVEIHETVEPGPRKLLCQSPLLKDAREG